jgi:Envelope integrity protein A
MRNMIISLAAASVLCAATYASGADSSAPVADNATPDATVSLKGGSVAVGIGYTWGHGELKYRDAPHQFSINGVSIVDVGATDYTATGNVYNLKDLSDFAGNYVAAGAGITVAGGGTAVYLKNEHGVVIKLISTDVGLKFNLSANGVHIGLKT